MLAPLADRMRPQSVEDMVGQDHLLGTGRALGRIIQSGRIPNMIFYGPSGVGKTTLAGIIASQSGMRLHKLNGTTASTQDIRDVTAEIDTLAGRNGILLYLDEIQYFNKKQQQSLLESIEKGSITLIASTTENPYFYIYNALLSRCTVFEFRPVEPAQVLQAVERAFDVLRQERGDEIFVEPAAARYIASACGGDVRKAISAAELSVLAAFRGEKGVLTVTEELARELTQKSALRYDRDADEHYDCLSAFQKSMRGSDPHAALHYLARLLEAGDLPSVCRRLMVCAAEDVGLAYPQIIPIVKAAVDAAAQVGLPEAGIPLADAVVLVCLSPKSNSAYVGLTAALEDLRAGRIGDIPAHLKGTGYGGAEQRGHGQGYQYPHNAPDHWLPQQYLPDALAETQYYSFGVNKTEQAFKAYWDAIKGRRTD